MTLHFAVHFIQASIHTIKLCLLQRAEWKLGRYIKEYRSRTVAFFAHWPGVQRARHDPSYFKASWYAGQNPYLVISLFPELLSLSIFEEGQLSIGPVVPLVCTRSLAGRVSLHPLAPRSILVFAVGKSPSPLRPQTLPLGIMTRAEACFVDHVRIASDL